MRAKSVVWMVLGVLLVWSAVSSRAALAQSARDGAAPPQSAAVIAAARMRSNAAIARHDTLGIAREWMPDVHLVTSTSMQGTGVAANMRRMAEQFTRRPDTRYVRTPESIDVMEAWDVASERGSWIGTWTEPDGALTIGGTYLAQWRRVNGEWRIQAELFVPLACAGSSYCSKRP